MDLGQGFITCHAPGSVAILNRKSISTVVKPLLFGLDWCVGVNVKIDEKSFTLIADYLPYQCPENENEYQDKLGQLTLILNSIDTSSFSIIVR